MGSTPTAACNSYGGLPQQLDGSISSKPPHIGGPYKVRDLLSHLALCAFMSPWLWHLQHQGLLRLPPRCLIFVAYQCLVAQIAHYQYWTIGMYMIIQT